MSKRRLALTDHPFWQEARLIRELLKEDREAAKTGRIVIEGNPDEYIPRLTAQARELERLARLDTDYPQEEA